MLNKKWLNFMAKKTNKTGDREKSLCDWAYEGLFFDDAQQFLSLCKNDDYEETDMITYREFLALKKKFGF